MWRWSHFNHHFIFLYLSCLSVALCASSSLPLFVPGGGRGAASANSLKCVDGMSQQICREMGVHRKHICDCSSRAQTTWQYNVQLLHPLCTQHFEMDQMTGENTLVWFSLCVELFGFAAASSEMNLNGHRLTFDPGLCSHRRWHKEAVYCARSEVLWRAKGIKRRVFGCLCVP